MRYIVNEDVALRSLSLGHGCMGATTTKNFEITQKKKQMRERLRYKSVRCHDTYLYVKKPGTYRVTYNSQTILR